jgi:hypothetical protein
MFRWHSTRLRVVSARINTDNAIKFLSSLSICWRKLVFRTITSDVSRSYELSKLEPSESSLSPRHDIYISTSTNPFFNLTLEDWYVSFFELYYVPIKLTQLRNMHNSFLIFFMLFDGRRPRWFFFWFFFFFFFQLWSYGRLFRHSPPSSPLLLIYRDSPCVIIGRNQNPWTEINFTALNGARIPFIRRRSGGGTVYHVS